jgi:integrase
MPHQVIDAPSTKLSLPTFIVSSDVPPQPHLPLDEDERARADDEIKARMWPLAYEQWLSGGWKSHGKAVSDQTRKAYRRAVEDFSEFIGRDYPMWRVMGSQVIGWQNAMRGAGLSETTINLRLAGLSSLFSFLCDKWPYPDPLNHGHEAFLVHRNPVRSANRTHVDPYDKSDGMTRDELLAMLRRIDQSSVEGLRDYALIVTYICTGQRSTAIASLRWGDIVHPKSEKDVIFYAWSSKGKTGRNELLRPAYDAICAYLRAAERLDTMAADDFVFIALSDAARHLDEWRARARGKPMPERIVAGHITSARINAIIKRWARKAGLDESRIHTHILRHTAADLFMELSNGDLLGLQEFLHHSNVSTTRIYVTRRKKERHPLWASVGAFFEMV